MVKYLVALVLLATWSGSIIVRACEPEIVKECWLEVVPCSDPDFKDRCLMVHTREVCRPDTAREYMRGDTVLTCPDCWELVVQVYWRDSVSESLETRYCVPLDDVNNPRGYDSLRLPDTTLDTTWLPKVQVWLDSAAYKDYLEWLGNDSVIYSPIRIGDIVDELDRIVEKYQD